MFWKKSKPILMPLKIPRLFRRSRIASISSSCAHPPSTFDGSCYADTEEGFTEAAFRVLVASLLAKTLAALTVLKRQEEDLW
jgi:hypothetical protein